MTINSRYGARKLQLQHDPLCCFPLVGLDLIHTPPRPVFGQIALQLDLELIDSRSKPTQTVVN
jgi:hypothetical protein